MYSQSRQLQMFQLVNFLSECTQLVLTILSAVAFNSSVNYLLCSLNQIVRQLWAV